MPRLRGGRSQSVTARRPVLARHALGADKV